MNWKTAKAKVKDQTRNVSWENFNRASGIPVFFFPERSQPSHAYDSVPLAWLSGGRGGSESFLRRIRSLRRRPSRLRLMGAEGLGGLLLLRRWAYSGDLWFGGDGGSSSPSPRIFFAYFLFLRWVIKRWERGRCLLLWRLAGWSTCPSESHGSGIWSIKRAIMKVVDTSLSFRPERREEGSALSSCENCAATKRLGYTAPLWRYKY